ncbi:cytochrome P450 [Streptomyces qinzhouensis]|uniref:Cytochrome P450 n=1 Tax=Streptomyces qinzhouensis TaxID=2599401 RepID=A0A5B8JD12_9ACTN|nr:cytochrome P450 [Streptomyces qinzhouensis]QDY75540.1 cytochrome P450 [Streptomyces qinzhouensis]
MAHAPVLADDLFAPAALDDPYPLYERLRAAGPVHFLPALGLHLVVRHAEVLAALDDPATYSSHLVGLLYAGEDGVSLLAAGGPDGGGADVLATADPPAHTGHRRIVQQGFGRGRVAELRADVERLVAPRVAALVAAGGGDWMAGLATPLPVLVISRILGLPDADAGRLTAWSDAAVELLGGLAGPERTGGLALEIVAFTEYLHGRLDAAGRVPAGGLVDEIAAARADGRLSRDEAAGLLLQLVTAGSESTTSLLGSAVRMLAADPALQDRVRTEPALLEAVIEEALRLESPFRGHFRVTTRDAELGGVHLPEGARLMLLWGAANRDPGAFEGPDLLDPGRSAVRSHTAFGRGLHFCLGAHLARLEAMAALSALLDATVRIALPSGDRPSYVPSMFVRRLDRLPLLLTPAPDGGATV